MVRVRVRVGVRVRVRVSVWVRVRVRARVLFFLGHLVQGDPEKTEPNLFIYFPIKLTLNPKPQP